MLVRLIFCSLISTLLLLGSSVASAQAQPSKTLRVGVYHSPPKLFFNEQHQMDGIFADLLNEIARQESWELVPIPCELGICIEGLKTGYVDIVPGLSAADVNMRRFSAHTLPALEDWVQIYARPGSTYKSILDLDQKRIATYLDSGLEKSLPAQLRFYGLHAELIPQDNAPAALLAVTENHADVAAVNSITGLQETAFHNLLPTAIVFDPVAQYFVAKQNQQVDTLEIINSYLEAWQNAPEGESFYSEIIGKWNRAAPPKQSLAVFWGSIALLGAFLGLSVYFITRLRDKVTEQNRRLLASEKRLSIILDTVDAHIFIKDHELRYIYANRKMCEFFGENTDSIQGKTDFDLAMPARTALDIQQTDLKVLELGERIAGEEQLYDRRHQTEATFFAVRMLLTAEEINEDEDGVCGIATDITEYKATREANHRLAFYDTLTKLPNRSSLLKRLAHTLEDIKRKPSCAAVLFIDLDNFKHINDARGHLIGDSLLQRVAVRLGRLLSDTDMLARVGGDEFVVLVPDLNADPSLGLSNALEISERLRLSMEKPFYVDGVAYLSSVSIGVALLHGETEHIEDVLREADTAMYKAKAQGRNRVVSYATHMKEEVEERLSLERDLAFAIGTDQLYMYLQPQVNRNREIMGVELLIRWNHPTRGMISPERFIPIAEETQLINKLGDWILEQACQLLLLYANKKFSISINISPTQFLEFDFVQRVTQIIQRYNAPAHRLVFEVTEGMLMREVHHTIRLMNELVKLGIRFAIDDFGTGYSNLAALKRLPLYELKIDRSLILDIPEDSDSVAIVRAVLAMGQELRLHIVAEGVEKLDQVAFLNQYGCSAIQGHFYSQALSLDEWRDYTQQEHLL